MENRGPELAAVVILFLVLTWLVVALRCLVRVRILKSFGADDWFMVASLALFTLFCAFALGGIRYGTGRHVIDLDPLSISKALRFWFLCELAYVLGSTVLKIAIGLFLLRIAVHRRHIQIIRLTIGASSLFGVFFFFFILFQCSPISTFWNPTTPVGSCINPNATAAVIYAQTAVSAAVDWTFGILPVFLIWDVQMNRQTKITVAIILGLGAIGSTGTLVRIKYIEDLTKTDDFLFATLDVAIWSTVECGIGITAASIPTLRPLFKTFFNRIGFSGNTRSQGGATASSRMSPWRSARSGYQRSHRLDELQPDNGGTTTVMVEGSGWESGGGRGIGKFGGTDGLRRASLGRGRVEKEAEVGVGRISKTVGITYSEAPQSTERL